MFEVVCEFHDTEIISRFLIAADMENLNKVGMGSGNGFKLFNAFELAGEGVISLESFPKNHLDGAVCTREASGQPNIAVTATTDLPNQFVVWYLKILSGGSQVCCSGHCSYPSR